MAVPQFAGYGHPDDVFPVHENMQKLPPTTRKRLAGNVAWSEHVTITSHILRLRYDMIDQWFVISSSCFSFHQSQLSTAPQAMHAGVVGAIHSVLMATLKMK